MHFMIGKDKQMDMIYGRSFSDSGKIILIFLILKLKKKFKVPSCWKFKKLLFIDFKIS